MSTQTDTRQDQSSDQSEGGLNAEESHGAPQRVVIEIEGVSQQVIAQVWETLKAGEVPEGAAFTLARSLMDHPHWYAFYETIGIFDLGENSYPGDVDPFLHVNLHFLIGLQILSASPAGARDFYEARAALQEDPHEIIHMMLEAFQRHLMWTAMHAGPEGQFDMSAYEETLSVLEDLDRDELWERLGHDEPPELHPEAHASLL